MTSLTAALPAPSAPAFADTAATATEEEVPLGWECANPTLQIERWGAEAPVAEPLR